MEDITSKTIISLPDFKGKPIFDKIQIPDKERPFDKSNTSEKEKSKSKKLLKKLSKTRVDRNTYKVFKK